MSRGASRARLRAKARPVYAATALPARVLPRAQLPLGPASAQLGGQLLSPVARLANAAVSAPGEPLAERERAAMESRFGHDFGGVRIHPEQKRGSTAAALGTRAYTLGEHIVMSPDMATADSATRHRLLAHELAHVVQQSGHSATASMRLSSARQEGEARQAATEVLAGRSAPVLTRDAHRSLAPFSDETHHAIEEAALADSGLSPAEVKSIERGNTRRDYSQVPSALNAVLLPSTSTFGGYRPEEHFDNFTYDTQTGRWRTRGVGEQKFLHLDPAAPDPSPLDYVTGQLLALARAGVDQDSLEHLGNAFHTVEDFFAHSNFLELTRGDTRFGTDLLTGSFASDPANSAVSLAHKFGAVSTPQMKQYYDKVAEENTARTEPFSHSRIAKDSPEAQGFTAARRLAALVIQQLAAEVITAMHGAKPEDRVNTMEATVIARIKRYLRPPDPKDPWWEALTQAGGATMDARLAEAERRAPATVNQWVGSPLRNLEASRDSPLAMPVGVAIPAGGSSFFQVGAGVTRPNAFDPRLPEPAAGARDQRSQPFIGAQFTARFR